jgi:hypothetical protein
VTRHPDWASSLIEALRQRTQGEELSADGVQLHEITAISPEAVEVTYSQAGDTCLRGIRVDAASVRGGLGGMAELTFPELAFYLVYVGICEPRSIDEYSPADSDGVRWLPLEQWLE